MLFLEDALSLLSSEVHCSEAQRGRPLGESTWRGTRGAPRDGPDGRGRVGCAAMILLPAQDVNPPASDSAGLRFCLGNKRPAPHSEQPGQDSWGLQPLFSVTGGCRSLQGAGQMALDGPGGDIFPRERQKLNAEKGSRGRAPLCVWILRSWGRTSSALATHGGCCSLPKTNTADEDPVWQGALCPSRLFCSWDHPREPSRHVDVRVWKSS